VHLAGISGQNKKAAPCGKKNKTPLAANDQKDHNYGKKDQ
jgi:hypothetical protein